MQTGGRARALGRVPVAVISQGGVSRAAFTWARPGITPASGRVQLRQGTVAFGPQHPAAHGILKLQLQLQGEVVRYVDPQFGFLHRGSEKLAEGRTVLQALPYFDRFDYVANLFQEHAYCLAVESLENAQTTPVAVQLARLVFDELSRILNHLLTLSATALDLSAMGPIFWAFEERELIMELCEQASGARMHTALYRPGSFDFSVFSGVFFRELGCFLTRCARSLSGAFLGLLNNRSLKSRLAYVGQLTSTKVLAYGVTGLIGRSAGCLHDLRLQGRINYSLYRSLALRVYVGHRGDNLDRFLLRIKEVAEGFRVLSQLVGLLTPQRRAQRQGPTSLVSTSSPRLVAVATGAPSRGFSPELRWHLVAVALTDDLTFGSVRTQRQPGLDRGGWLGGLLTLTPTKAFSKFSSMEALITHFRAASEGGVAVRGFSYGAVESPKGEVGVSLVGSGLVRPYRLKLRTPVSHNMHLIPTISTGATFADLVATFCSLDIVMGEIDR